ncbi:hypothetical protein ABEB36_008505 [Hypothenemus hampei]|uniref:Retinoblastoma-like protein 1 n=1 Tax=Hypothenemus hampei TaxID=57062 RepID=A0ABD1EM40_HYPHA
MIDNIHFCYDFSFVQFFSNITRWAEMAQLPNDFQQRIDTLRSNFSISHNIFKTFHPLFTEVFIEPIPNNLDLEYLKPRNRKNKPIPCTSLKVFEFIWNLFIILKAENAPCSDLVSAHHLLYCCIDFIFTNAVVANKQELINSKLHEELQFSDDLTTLADIPCLVKRFCKCESVIKEALHMKVYTFKQLITRIIKNKLLLVDENTFTGLFENDYFDQSFRNITRAYETQLLNHGDFDEKIFLVEFKRVLMEKDQGEHSWMSMKNFPPGDSVDDALLLESPKVTGGTNRPKELDTPLTGRKFLGPRENELSGRSTSEKISRLHTIIGDRTASPSDELTKIFVSCQRDPTPKINEIISKMKEKLLKAYKANNFSTEEAENRLNLAHTLFYKYVELILAKEKNMTSNISNLVENNVFYQAMFACCLVIVLYCYDFPKKFTWILDVLNLEPIQFVKVIELIVRTKDNFFRDLIKHLNRIEETIMESLVWRSNSPIWDAIEKSGQGIPKFEDTALPGHLLYNDTSNEHLLQSPEPASASDRFQSPLSELCRNLFPSSGSGTHLIVSDKDGKMKLIPLVEGDIKLDNQQRSPETRPDPQAAALPRRTGSLSIIFRKFYNLAGVRMQHLCSHLGFEDFELRRKIWTVFEDSIRNTDLIKDRHLDQLLMCAIYVICKAANITPNKNPNMFANIMKYYRQQPQASSSVYRDVLIGEEKNDDGGIVIKRGDLIQFYNFVYVKAMQTYATRLQSNTNSKNHINLSPLPTSRKDLISSNLQIVSNIFIKPLETSVVKNGPTADYYFSRSPSKDLMDINRLINNSKIQGKRLLIDEEGNVQNKRHRKLQSLVEERQRQNAPQ